MMNPPTTDVVSGNQQTPPVPQFSVLAAPPPPMKPKTLGRGSLTARTHGTAAAPSHNSKPGAVEHVTHKRCRIGPEKLEWGSAESVTSGKSGARDVIFVTMPKGTVMVKEVVEDDWHFILATQLAHRIGVKVPAVNLVETSCSEWNEISSVVESLDTTRAEKQRRPFLVMELAPGQPLDTLTKSKLSEVFNTVNTLQISSPEMLHYATQKNTYLRQFGNLMFFDALCNSNRLPLLNGRECQLGAIFYDNSDGIWGINGFLQPLPLNKQPDYISQLSETLGAMSKHPQRLCVEIASMKEFLGVEIGLSSPVESFIQVQFGVMEAFVRACELYTSFTDIFEQIQVQASPEFNQSLKLVCIPFIQNALNICHVHYDQAVGVLKHWPAESVCIAEHPTSSTRTDVKILVMQERYGGEDTAEVLDELLSSSDNADRKTDMVIFPELWLWSHSGGISVKQKGIAQFVPVAIKHAVFIVLGTMEEVVVGGARYITSVMLGPDGQIAGSYRKQRLTTLSHEPGTVPGVFTTPFGKVAILICFDVENEDVFNATMALDPLLILNPVFIPSPDPRYSTPAALCKWAVARDSMRRKFEATMGEKMTHLIRCDMPSSHGAFGSSQYIGPYHTTMAPSPLDCHFYVHADTTIQNFWKGSSIPPHGRTAKEDNTGNRYLCRLLQAPTASRTLAICGKTLAIVTADSSAVMLWSTVIAHSVAQVIPPSSGVHVSCMCFIPRVQVLVVCWDNRTLSTIHITMATNSASVQTNLLGTAPMPALACSCIPLEETRFVVGHLDGTLSAWKIDPFLVVSVSPHNSEIVATVKIDRGGLCVIWKDGSVGLFSIENASLQIIQLQHLDLPSSITAVTWSDSRHLLLIGTSAGTITLVSTQPTVLFAEVQIGHFTITGLIAVPNSDFVVVSNNTRYHNLYGIDLMELQQNRRAEVSKVCSTVDVTRPLDAVESCVYMPKENQVYMIGRLPCGAISLDIATGAINKLEISGHPPPITHGCAVTVLSDHEIAVFGGINDSTNTLSNDFHVLNTQIMEWKNYILPDPPLPRYKAASVLVNDFHLLIHGGRQTTADSVASMLAHSIEWRFPSRWNPVPESVSAHSRAGHSITSVGGVPVMFGGWAGTVQDEREWGALGDVRALQDFNSDTLARWEQVNIVGTVIPPRDCHAAAASSDSLWISCGVGPTFEYWQDINRICLRRYVAVPPLSVLAGGTLVQTLTKTTASKKLVHALKYKKEEWDERQKAQVLQEEELHKMITTVMEERNMVLIKRGVRELQEEHPPGAHTMAAEGVNRPRSTSALEIRCGCLGVFLGRIFPPQTPEELLLGEEEKLRELRERCENIKALHTQQLTELKEWETRHTQQEASMITTVLRKILSDMFPNRNISEALIETLEFEWRDQILYPPIPESHTTTDPSVVSNQQNDHPTAPHHT
ncbi:hydrolase, carbonnitrogen superfamily protein [Pelomyxa schiedti]|nr:hydrolase, carbonnitrogen superfamily protein [Pelomyxa schiedti]